MIPDAPFFELAPDWVCEIVSPSTGKLDRVKKMPHYARWGVSHLWFVDPLQRTLDRRVVGTYGDDEKVRAEPFDAIELDLALLWAR